jgi:D-serine dehydratase
VNTTTNGSGFISIANFSAVGVYNCTFAGVIQASSFCAGIINLLNDTALHTIYFYNSTLASTLITGKYQGGLISYANTSVFTIKLTNCTTTQTLAGAYAAGYVAYAMNSTIALDNSSSAAQIGTTVASASVSCITAYA